MEPNQFQSSEFSASRRHERSADGFETIVCPNDLLCACCNIYCQKPQPCIPCFASGCGVTYCPKPLPRVHCFAIACSAHCYCPKPCPNLCQPIAADYYRCAESALNMPRQCCAVPNRLQRPAPPTAIYVRINARRAFHRLLPLCGKAR